jgi:hypothetical protein
MFCERCGDQMRPETIVKLRRRFGRVRARYFDGAYCAGCKTGVSMEAHTDVVPKAQPQAGVGWRSANATVVAVTPQRICTPWTQCRPRP